MGKFFPNFQGKLNYYLLQSVPEKKKKEINVFQLIMW